MMDFLGLLGEKPIMPIPPKVGPLAVPVVEPGDGGLLVSVGGALGSAGGVVVRPVPGAPGPTPAIVERPIGCPKKPMAVGALFWPYRTGFQSSLPVVGSAYFLRRKRMLLVGLTRASTLGG